MVDQCTRAIRQFSQWVTVHISPDGDWTVTPIESLQRSKQRVGGVTFADSTDADKFNHPPDGNAGGTS